MLTTGTPWLSAAGVEFRYRTVMFNTHVLHSITSHTWSSVALHLAIRPYPCWDFGPDPEAILGGVHQNMGDCGVWTCEGLLSSGGHVLNANSITHPSIAGYSLIGNRNSPNESGICHMTNHNNSELTWGGCEQGVLRNLGIPMSVIYK